MKHSKRGGDHTYSEVAQGYSLKGSVTEHGYKAKLAVDINYAALTDKDTAKVRTMLYDLIAQVLNTSTILRRDTIPLFNVDEPQLFSQSEGINER